MDFILSHLASFGEKHIQFLLTLCVNLFVIWIICRFIDIINKRVLINLRVKVTDYPMLTIIPISLRALKFVIACLIIAGFLQSFGYNVTSIVAGLGIVGLAIGFAAQTTIGNVFGSFSLLIDKVYKVGDYIQYDTDKAGYVENINLRSTTLRTAEGFLTNVPNNLLANTAITNVSQTCKYKIDIKIAIECDTNIQNIKKAVDIMQNAVQHESLVKDSSLAYIESLEDTAINLRVVAYTHNTKWKEYMILKSDILAIIIESFQKENINFDIPDSRISIDNTRKLFEN